MITHPFPKTYWCKVPREDMTDKSLCRPSQARTPRNLYQNRLVCHRLPPRYHLPSLYPKNTRGIAHVDEHQVQHPRFIPEPLHLCIPSDQTTWCAEPRQRATLTVPSSHTPHRVQDGSSQHMCIPTYPLLASHHIAMYSHFSAGTNGAPSSVSDLGASYSPRSGSDVSSPPSSLHSAQIPDTCVPTITSESNATNEAKSPNTGTTKQTGSWVDDYGDNDNDEDNLW